MRRREILRTKRQNNILERLLDGDPVNSNLEDDEKEIIEESKKVLKGLGSNVYPIL